MMKRIITAILALILTLALCSCDETPSEKISSESCTPSPAADTPEPSPDVKVKKAGKGEKSEPVIGWVDNGPVHLFVPEKFVEAKIENPAKAPGVYPFSYIRRDLDMNIDVTYFASPSIMFGDSWLEDFYANYSRSIDVTYDYTSEDFYTVSGYIDDKVYYISSRRVGDVGYEVYITYPAANKGVCDQIVGDFMKNVSY